MYSCRCGDVFEDGESIGIDYGMCQMCWEHYCATKWWDKLNRVLANPEPFDDEPGEERLPIWHP